MTYAILWDLDGTIADTTDLHFHSWRQTLAAEGEDVDWDWFIRGFGRSNADILPDLFGPDLAVERMQRISDAKEAAFRALARQQGLNTLPGVDSWLARFHAAGFPQTISSSAPMANILVMLDALEIGDLFWALITGFPLPKGKPDPDIFLRSAAAVDLPPTRCVVIEDSIHGVEGAIRAGMACVAVGQRLVEMLPDDLSAHLPDLGGREAPILAVGNLNALDWEQFNALMERM